MSSLHSWMLEDRLSTFGRIDGRIKNLLNNFIKAYIEKNGIISKNCLHITLYNYNTLKQITTIYNIPHKILKEDVKQNIAENKEEQYILEYKNSNMIDFLGKVCLNDNEYNSLYINNSIYIMILKKIY